MKTRSALCYLLTFLCLSALAQAQTTYTVTTTADGVAGSLRAAIANATPGDVIEFGVTGTIALTRDRGQDRMARS